MTLFTFVQVFTVCLIGAMSPGPSMAVVINNAIFKGRYNGILTSIGHGIGIAVYATFAVLGLGLIIETNIFIFNSLKILSIIFLIYLGLYSIINNKKIHFDQNQTHENLRSFLEGFSISILNPKILIWFVAIYSQFMSVNNDAVFNVFLVIIAGLVDASWYIILTFIVTTKNALDFFKKKSQTFQNIIGILFIVIGFLLLGEILINF